MFHVKHYYMDFGGAVRRKGCATLSWMIPFGFALLVALDFAQLNNITKAPRRFAWRGAVKLLKRFLFDLIVPSGIFCGCTGSL